MKTIRLILFVLLYTLTAGCAAWRGAPPEDVGRLRVQMTDVVMDGRAARLSGTVTSEFRERVEGVRYVITVRDAENPGKVFERFERQTDTIIEPRGHAPMSLDVAGDAFNEEKFRIAITATPIKLGGRPVPPPAD
jgi:hypothetical protein